MNRKYNSILNAAIELFLDRGVKKTTMDEVAEEACASKVTVYKYFRDKDNLLRKVCEFLYDEYLAELRTIKESNRDIYTKISDSLDEITDFIESGRFELCGELGEHNMDIKKDNSKNRTVFKSIITALIDEGKSAGIIRDDIKSEFVYYYIDMSASYYYSNEEYRDLMRSDAAFQKEFLQFYTENIFTN